MIARSREGANVFLYGSLLLLYVFLFSAFALNVVSCRAAPASVGGAQIGFRLLTDRAVGPAAAEVTLKASDGTPLGGAQVTLRGDMTHAGMGPQIAQMHEVAKGTYVADGFRFTMGGDWLLTVQAVLPGGERVERVFDVPGVAGG